ncbi:hypothetical protein AGLY_002281 [Aphis glycines]|uniref:SWIM-type domain-containing protein n=1 Tax=Aphis glycines TaxID=307491 RepID=A0A6G0U2Y5_APHGL|nr:hypothetical protein AGLY_002281 [Aphis glycines]
MVVIKLLYFPDFTIPESSSTNWRSKKKILLLSLPSVHDHAIETSLLNLPVDTSILKEISRLVNNGFFNIKIVSSMLKDLVERTCTTAPSPIFRAFYPDEKTLRNCMIKFTYEKYQSKIDQHALDFKIEQWKKTVKPLIFCHQTEWQRHLITRYSNTCLLDAAYKTTKYALPLFFLVVKTNVNYCVAATFIVQCKDSDSITEALYMIKSWNDNIAKVFNNCPTYICDFHREQAWLRWTNKQGNLHVKDDREKWTNRFFKDEYDIKISTNNGVETQNKVIKSFYLKLTSDKSLNSTIETIIDQFLPESLKKYHLKNLKLTGERPEPFVKHIYNRLSTAQNIYSENKIKKLELEHTFHVKSEDGTCVYTINFLIANCTCIDYIKFHWPCKHLCAIFLYIPGYSFDDLPEIFLNNPFISPDPRYSITNRYVDYLNLDPITLNPRNYLPPDFIGGFSRSCFENVQMCSCTCRYEGCSCTDERRRFRPGPPESSAARSKVSVSPKKIVFLPGESDPDRTIPRLRRHMKEIACVAPYRYNPVQCPVRD